MMDLTLLKQLIVPATWAKTANPFFRHTDGFALYQNAAFWLHSFSPYLTIRA